MIAPKLPRKGTRQESEPAGDAGYFARSTGRCLISNVACHPILLQLCLPVLTPTKTPPDLSVLQWLRSNKSTCHHFGQSAPAHGYCTSRRTSVYSKSPANRPGDVPVDTLAEMADRVADYSGAHSLNAVTSPPATAAYPALASIEKHLDALIRILDDFVPAHR
ncbi:hypothetical protein HPB50_028932 [Hyalomma asiaticum]|nr:hypothetical protein HPB50_028932 [Hyalomma asiaticum]